MAYPETGGFESIYGQISAFAALKHEYGAPGIGEVVAEAQAALEGCLERIKALPEEAESAAREPDELEAIRALCPAGPRVLWTEFPEEQYRERLTGALLGRMAGCTLGALVEGWPVDRMERLARAHGQAFPPVEYWRAAPEPLQTRYSASNQEDYTRDKMEGVPVDDDIAYTLLGLLVAEDYGPGFTIEENAEAWRKYLPYACTAEQIALANLEKGIPAREAADLDNPYVQWIGADIRSDPWGYLAPGRPELAAEMAWRDAYLSHRRNGIFGEMYFSAVISAAFVVDDPVEALEIGLTEIPAHCAMAEAVRWALEMAQFVTNYQEARAAVDERFAGMSGVHTLNNACLTIWGLTIGGTDFTRVISETVAMGLDNDCTGATAGSIAGAIVGNNGIPEHWHARFNDTVRSYLIGHPEFRITDLVERFTRLAKGTVGP